jgi:Fic family protein
MLSKRGLYPSIGGSLKHSKSTFQSMLENEENLDLLLNTLFFSDGYMTIEQIAIKSNLSEKKIYECSKTLVQLNLLEKIV